MRNQSSGPYLHLNSVMIIQPNKTHLSPCLSMIESPSVAGLIPILGETFPFFAGFDLKHILNWLVSF